MQKPLRPFESLEWYRRARRGQDDEHPWLSRARSLALVQRHINLFAVGSVSLLAINLLRSPERVWADTAIAVWSLLVVMHALAAGIVALLMQLLADEDVRPASEVRWDPMRTWTASLPAAAPQAGIPAASAAPEPSAVPAASSEAAPPPGWGTEPAQSAPAPDGERASWAEVSAAAWLARHSAVGQDGTGDGREPTPDPSETRPSETPGDRDASPRQEP